MVRRVVVPTIGRLLVTVAAVLLRLAVGAGGVAGWWLIGLMVVLTVESAGSSGQKSNGKLFHSDFSLSIIKTKKRWLLKHIGTNGFSTIIKKIQFKNEKI